MNTQRSSHSFQWACLAVCLCLILGCGKKTASSATAGINPGAGNNAPATGEGASGRNLVLQVPFDNAAKLVMLNIGVAYRQAMATNDKPPKNMDELGLEPKNLKTKRDMQDREIEVLLGVDNRKLDEASNFALAWEKTPDNGGGRMVLMADFVTVKYVSNAEFEAMKKAK